MATPSTYATTSVAGFASGCWESIHQGRKTRLHGCWGPEATEFAKSTLLGQRVALIYDQSQGLYDRYGRTLAYLDKADGWDYSIEAARAGAAHAYVYHDKPAARSPAIAAAEQEAKDAQRGLWGPPCHGTPRPFPIRTRGPWCR
jgi:micrococcal nuclease